MHGKVQGGPYIWQDPAWPHGLRWHGSALQPGLQAVRTRQGRLAAKAALLGVEDAEELHLNAMSEEAVRTARIEGEQLQRDSVRSSVRRHLGREPMGLSSSQRAVDGLVEVLLDATRRASEPLTAERLFAWHASLFPTGRSGMRRITVGGWRTGSEPMQVVARGLDTVDVRFQAPPSARVPSDMQDLLIWIEHDTPVDGLLRAGLAHLWFETIHPFDDGNGRIGRALADLLLTRDQGGSTRLWSLSAEIDAHRADYYAHLGQAQRGDGDVTAWLAWFLDRVADGLDRGEARCDRVLARLRFWAHHGTPALNARQAKLMDRLLRAGRGGFEGGMSTRKAVALTGASRATAQRDLADLVDKGLLVPRAAGGRSTAYDPAWPG